LRTGGKGAASVGRFLDRLIAAFSGEAKVGCMYELIDATGFVLEDPWEGIVVDALNISLVDAAPSVNHLSRCVSDSGPVSKCWSARLYLLPK
jgi:hypothetical protein